MFPRQTNRSVCKCIESCKCGNSLTATNTFPDRNDRVRRIRFEKSTRINVRKFRKN